jgi:hypothetical protein
MQQEPHFELNNGARIPRLVLSLVIYCTFLYTLDKCRPLMQQEPHFELVGGRPMTTFFSILSYSLFIRFYQFSHATNPRMFT